MAPLSLNLKSKLLVPILLFFSAFFFRTLFLSYVPLSLSHDEVDTVIQAHSVRLYGTDLNSSWKPLSLLPNDGVMGELVPLIHALALSLLPNSLFSARFTSTFLSSLYPILLYFLLGRLRFGSRVSLIAALLLIISPWHILFSRSAMEQPTSLFFYILSWIFLFNIYQKKPAKYIILNTIYFSLSYALGFFTYHGYKFSLPLLTLALTIYLFIINHFKPKVTLIISSIIVIFLLSWPLFFRSHYQSRGSELSILNISHLTDTVNSERRIALMPLIVEQLFSNKLVAYSQYILNKSFTLFSPQTLFAFGEGGGVFGTGRSGYLYLISLPFLILGLGQVIMRRSPEHNLLLTLLFLSPVSTLLHQNNSFAFRSGFYLVLLTILTALGLDYFLSRFSTRLISFVLIFIFILSFGRFLYIYYGFYPTESAHEYFLGDRLLGYYLKLAPTEDKILVMDSQPRYIASYFILAHRTIDHTLLSSLRGKYLPDETKNNITIGNFTIRRNCPEDWESYDTIIVDPVIAPGLTKCLPALPRTALTYPLDSSVAKYIYGDKLCSGQILPSSVNPPNLRSLGLDEVSSVQFCSNWVTTR